MADELFDTHIHLDRLPREELGQELEEAQKLGISSFLLPGVAPERWDDLPLLAGEHRGLFLAPGLHPLAADRWSPACAARLIALLDHPATVALGEIGLDSASPVAMELQEEAYRAQLRIAVAANLPLLLHCRGTLTRALQIFSEEGGPGVGGILHAFSGSREMADIALRLNLTLGFGGALTWPEARRAPEILRTLPAKAFVLESDAPDQSPEPHRRERNRPAWLAIVARRAAELRNCSYAEIAVLTTGNARRVLRLASPPTP